MAYLSSSFMSLPCVTTPTCKHLYQRFFSSRPSIKKFEVIKCSNEIRTHTNDNEDAIRRVYHPSVWEGHDFISSSTSTFKLDEGRLKELKKEVKSILSLATNDSFQELDLVDNIQRLGLTYHFEAEIEDILQRTYNANTHFFVGNVDDVHLDLYYVSLWFRLLRQAGYYVSPGVFNKFKGQNGEFHAILASDVKGMLSLYEASYLGLNGEDIMDEALAFTTKHLNSIVTCLTPTLASEVQNALKIPLQKAVERVQARHYISVYQEDKSRNETLLEFAKLDFNNVQLLHQKELSEVQRWWDRINFKSKLPFDIRDRVVEAYVINMGINFAPKFSLARIHFAKVWCILSIIDDAHDVHGDLEELGPLFHAIQRWDAGDVNELPYHMKVIFDEVINLVIDIEVDMAGRGHLIGIPYLKREIQIFAKGEFEELKTLFSTDLPTVDKWLSISYDTAGLNCFLVNAVMHLGELATKDVFDWIASGPKILKCYYLICRIVDDIVGFKEEQARGQVASTVTCYMKEHGVSESEAIKSLQKMIPSLWKDMNEESLRPNLVPRLVMKIIFNIIRDINLFYNDVDGHTNSVGRTKEIITSLLIDPISI